MLQNHNKNVGLKEMAVTAGLREVTATTDGLREVTTTVGNELSLPLVVAVPTAVTVLVTFGITLMVVHILHKWRKAKQRKYLESR